MWTGGTVSAIHRHERGDDKMTAVHGKGLSAKKAARVVAAMSSSMANGESIRLIALASGLFPPYEAVVVTDRRVCAVNLARSKLVREANLEDLTSARGDALQLSNRLVYATATSEYGLKVNHLEDMRALLAAIDEGRVTPLNGEVVGPGVQREELLAAAYAQSASRRGKRDQGQGERTVALQRLADAMKARAEHLKSLRASQPAPMQITSWLIAEQNAANWMRYLGFSDARVTAGGSDGGVDVTAVGAIAQVKFEAAQVGRPALQRLLGARGLRHETHVLFFSGSGYSQQASIYADEVGMALFVYKLDGRIVACSATARHMLRASESPQASLP